MPIETRNPATGELVEAFHELTGDEIDSRLDLAFGCYQRYRGLGYKERAVLLRRAADLLAERVEEIARVITIEIGRPLGGSSTTGLDH